MNPLPFFDAHCDTLSRCAETGENLYQNSGQCDIKRLCAFEPWGQVFALFTDSAALPEDECFALLKQQAQLYKQAKNLWPNQMENTVLSIEGAELLGCDSERLKTVYGWGVRLLNITWNHANALSGSCREESGRGLSPEGRRFAQKAYATGILLDVSHLSDPGFWDLAELAQLQKRPLVASHSCSRAVYPHCRNLTDEQFLAISQSGGIVGINLFTEFVGKKGTMEELLAHFEHFLALGGESTLALGCDWDGDITGAGGLSGVQEMNLLAEALYKRGYSEALIRAIFYENLAALLKKNETGNFAQ